MRRLVFIFCLLLALQLSATTKTLTDTQGRSIRVELIAKSESGVLVSRLPDRNEFEIKYDMLSLEDREFLWQWEPPAPDVPNNPIDAVVIMRSSGDRKKGYGSGFLAHDKGKTYVYTNQHVISDIMNIEAVDTRGKLINLGELEVSNNKDLARFRVAPRPALQITDDVMPNAEIIALGNSEGAGVITTEAGKVLGIGPSEIEVSTKFVPGNSGGPVINKNSQVIGVATYIKRGQDAPDWVKSDTRYSKNRRFTLRPSRVDDWREMSRRAYHNQVSKLKSAMDKFDQAYWTYYMLVERKGYLSTLPEDWEREILMILRSHNRRQKEPDTTTTYNTYSDSNGYVYTTPTVISHAEDKAGSLRNNLRALDRYVSSEFTGGDMIYLSNIIDVGYLANNEFGGLKALESWVKQMRASIDKEINFSKDRF